jgi:hypothetical protein
LVPARASRRRHENAPPGWRIAVINSIGVPLWPAAGAGKRLGDIAFAKAIHAFGRLAAGVWRRGLSLIADCVHSSHCHRLARI